MMGLIRFIYFALRRYYDSVNYAIEGILHAAKTQSHVRFHLISSCFLLLICFSLGIRPEEFIILTTLACIVIVGEMLNSAIEVTVDIASPEKSEQARIAKDIAAGAVLVAALVSLIIGFFVFYPYVMYYVEHGIIIAKHGPIDLVFGSMIIVLIVVIIIKAYVGKGYPLRGGMPSGHSSLLFAFWVNMVYIFQQPFLTVLVLVFAVGVAISRIWRRIHTVYEVCMGVFVGAGITWSLYLIFYNGQ
ncbi:MAG: diacylglycerol kinase [Spirochaetota bacterium]